MALVMFFFIRLRGTSDLKEQIVREGRDDSAVNSGLNNCRTEEQTKNTGQKKGLC